MLPKRQTQNVPERGHQEGKREAVWEERPHLTESSVARELRLPKGIPEKNVRTQERGNSTSKGTKVACCAQRIHVRVTREKNMCQEVALEKRAHPISAQVFLLTC